MTWIWEHPNWPHFQFDAQKMAAFERDFLHQAGAGSGAIKHINADDIQTLTIDVISEETFKTSEIEGEILNRDSLRASLQRHFGIQTQARKITPAEQGASDVMIDVHTHYNAPLTHDTLFKWHRHFMAGHHAVQDIGIYRTHTDPMQIVSNRLDTPFVHFEAPPSTAIPSEMDGFITWFNTSGHDNKMGALARAGIAHLYFECLHPFEDGNGRIGRVLVEKSLSQNIGRPTLITLAREIAGHKKEYYAALERNSRGDLDITDWLLYFAQTILAAQSATHGLIDFIIAKAKFYDRFGDTLNDRQTKVIARMFKEGPSGFKGGLSAENYIRITDAPRATTTRDLADLVQKGAFTKTGERRYTRYFLNTGLS